MEILVDCKHPTGLRGFSRQRCESVSAGVNDPFLLNDTELTVRISVECSLTLPLQKMPGKVHGPHLFVGGASADGCGILKKNKQSSRPSNWLTFSFRNECFCLYIVCKVTEGNSYINY